MDFEDRRERRRKEREELLQKEKELERQLDAEKDGRRRRRAQEVEQLRDGIRPSPLNKLVAMFSLCFLSCFFIKEQF